MRKICVLLVMCLMCGCFAHTAAAASADGNDEYAYEVLKSLGFVDKIGYTEDTLGYEVTNAEMAYVLARFIGIPDGKIKTTMFADVKPDSYAAAEINALAKRGYIRGTGMKFYPEESADIIQAIRAITAIENLDAGLTYESSDANYLSVAAQNKIFDGLNLSKKEFTRKDFLRMIYNTLEAKVYKRTAYGNTYSYERKNEYTVLHEFFDAYKGKGILESNDRTSLVTYTAVGKNKVEINGETYLCGKVRAEECIGRNVVFYYRENADGDNELLYLRPDGNEECALRYDEIVKYENNCYEYETENGKTKKARLSDRFVFVYNGIAEDNYINADLIPNYGKIVLTDNDSDGFYDVVFVYDYKEIVVDSVNGTTDMIYDKFESEPVKFDDADQNNTIKNTDGEELLAFELKEWDVLEVLESKNGKYIDITLLNEVIYGQITGKENDGKYTYVCVDDIKYKLSDYALKTSQKYIMGEYAYFYLNANDEIVAENRKKGGDYRCGVLVEVREITEKIDTNCVLKVFDESGKTVKMKCRKNIKLDGKIYKNLDKFYTEINNIFDGKFQLIRYKTDDTDTLTNIDTLKVNEEEDKSICARMGKSIDGIYSAGRNFDGKIQLDEDTKVFVVPEDGNTDEDYFKKDSIMYFSTDKTYKNIFPVYLGNDSLSAYALIVRRDTDSTTYNSDNSVVVSKIVPCINSDGDSVEKLYGYGALKNNYKKQSTVELLTAEDGVLSNLDVHAGDIIRYEVNEKNEIVSAVLDMCCKTMKGDAVKDITTDFRALYRITVGNVYERNGHVISLKAGNGGFEDMEYHDLNRYALFCFDTKTEKFKKIQDSDVCGLKANGTGSLIAVVSSSGYPRYAVVYIK